MLFLQSNETLPKTISKIKNRLFSGLSLLERLPLLQAAAGGMLVTTVCATT